MLNKRYKLVIVSILIIYVSFIITGCRITGNADQTQKRFDDFLNEVFIEEVQSDTLSLNYALAAPEKFGIQDNETTLGEYTIDYMNDELSTSENYLKKLSRFSYEELTQDQQLTYDILKNDLELDIKLGDYLYYSECLGPTTGIQAQLPILLAEYNFYDKDDIEQYIELLPCVYDYFEDIVTFEQEKSLRGLFMGDDVADSIIGQCNAFIKDPENNFLIEYFNEKISGFEGLTAEEAAGYMQANRSGVINYIIPAYELLISALNELKGTGINRDGLYYFPDGQAYYEYLASSKTGSDKSMEEMADMLDTAIGDGILKITKITLTEPDILNQYEDFASFPITDPNDIIEDLKNDISSDFPEPVPVDCEIKYIHESLSEYLSPAMYLVPAIDNYTDNSIYINGSSMETLSRIYTTVAHEGYPGHLYQCVYFRNQDPAPIRSLMNFLGYDEGWATYVEFYAYHMAGIDETLADFLEVNNAVVLFMYARADIGIQYEGWTEKEAVSYINGFTGDEAVARTIYQTLLEEPAIYLPYAVGYLEIMELKRKAEEALDGQFVTIDFHQFLLDIGPAQFGVIEDRIDEWIEAEIN